MIKALVTIVPKPLKVLGLDPSMRNWGAVACELFKGHLTVLETHITVTTSKKPKKLKQSLKDLDDATKLYQAMVKSFEWADVICVELPHGAQNARGALGNGVCYGVLAALSDVNPNIVYISANDLKAVVRADKEHKPSKQDVIAWVKERHPTAPIPTTASAEHVCDAITAIYAAMLKEQFKEYL